MSTIGYRIGKFIRSTQDDVSEGIQFVGNGTKVLAQHSATKSHRFLADVIAGYQETPDDRLKARIAAAKPLRIEVPA